ELFPDHDFVRQNGITLMPLARLLAEADYVTLHAPLNEQSKYLINRKTLALMKPTAFLVNTARGGLVCEADLVDALNSLKIEGAALCVVEEEPLEKNPLFAMDSVGVTPHAAGVDLQSRDDMALSSARSIVALSLAEWPAEQVVNPEIRGAFSW